VTTVTALLTNKAYGYPTRGSRRRRKPTILACLHQTANAHATALQERDYANRAGSGGPSATRGGRKPGFDHAASPWYSWMSPPSRSRRRTSPGLTGPVIGTEIGPPASGEVRPRARWGRCRL